MKLRSTQEFPSTEQLVHTGENNEVQQSVMKTEKGNGMEKVVLGYFSLVLAYLWVKTPF
jgi:hypothetical protein